MNIRNPKYNEHGTIDCEIEHPQHGWIPFTADQNDVEQIGRDVYAQAVSGNVAPYTPKPTNPQEETQKLAALRRAELNRKKDIDQLWETLGLAGVVVVPLEIQDRIDERNNEV